MFVVVVRVLVWAGLAGWSVLGSWGRGGVSSAVIPGAAVMTANRATNIGTEASANASGESSGSTLLLGLVLDEVDLGFAGLGGGWRRDDDVLLFVGLLDQHVDQGLLFVLGLQGDLRRLVGWGGRGLDEDDLVVLLGRGYLEWALDADLLRLWWWDVHVDVLLDDGLLGTSGEASEAASDGSTAKAAAAASETAGTASEAARSTTEAAGTAGAERG